MVTLAASTDLSGHQYKFVTVASDGRLALPSTGASVFGVLQNKPTEDQAGTVMIAGISKIKATASTMGLGDLVYTDSSGRASTGGAGDYAVARVVGGSSGAVDRVLSVEITPIGTT